MRRTIINETTTINKETLGANASQGELRTAVLCKMLGLTVSTESTYEFAPGKRRQYDFEGYVCDDHRFIIEVQGSQHFNEPEEEDWEPLRKTQLNDAEKQQYALNILKAKLIYINMRDADYTKYTKEYLQQHLTLRKLAKALLAEGPIQNIELDEE